MRKITGSGPIPATLMCIGEAPGEVEERFGQVFVGPSGAELDHLFEHAGIARSSVRIRNVLEFHPPSNRDPHPEEIARALPGVWAEIRRVRPKVIMPIGRFATHVFLPGRSMDYVQGLVFENPWGFAVFPVFHPAHALRKPSIFVPLYEAFAKLKDVLEGRVRPWRAAVPGQYHAMTNKDRLESPELALDTERTGASTWGLTWSSVPGQGVAVAAANRQGLTKVLAYIDRAETIYLHESLGDLETLAAMGLRVPHEKVVDTLILAFNLGLTAGEEQREGAGRLDRRSLGLKLLGFRLAGMEMRGFMEVMEPLDAEAMRAWLDRQITRRTDRKVARAIANAILQENPRKALARSKFTRDLDPLPMVIPWCGEMIEYAGMDADATRRIGPVLRAQIKEAGLEKIAALDHGVIPLVLHMQRHGLLVDTGQLQIIQHEMLDAERAIESRVGDQAWEGFNPRSHEQVGHLLFDQLNLPPVKWSKKTRAPSTDGKALAQLTHTLVDDLMDLRELRKLRSTYVEALL